MEEEKKEITEEQNQVNEEIKQTQEGKDEDYFKLKRSNSKKNAVIIVLVFVIILMLTLVLLYYFNNKGDKPKENSGNPTNTSTPESLVNPLSSDEAIKIAKEKIELANEFNYEDECRERYDETDWCYYASLDEFKNKFYSIYSTKLVYNDVMADYKSLTSYSDWSTNVKLEGGQLTTIPHYVISSNKVYRDSCNVGSGTYSSVAKFTVDSITNDRIKINYVVMEKEPDIENAKETEREKATIILVKEDNDWKILKATIVDMCNGVYTVGKES